MVAVTSTTSSTAKWWQGGGGGGNGVGSTIPTQKRTCSTTTSPAMVPLVTLRRRRISIMFIISHLTVLVIGILIGGGGGGNRRKNSYTLSSMLSSTDVSLTPTRSTTTTTRTVVVNSMCRCSSGAIPVPTRYNNRNNTSRVVVDTQIVQPPLTIDEFESSSSSSLSLSKHFVMEPLRNCKCLKKITTQTTNEGHGQPSYDMFLKGVGKYNYINETDTCTSKKKSKKKNQNSGSSSSSNSINSIHKESTTTKYTWKTMPELGVEQDLPLFVGILSYNSPKSLNASLYNWHSEHGLFSSDATNTKGLFIQLNHRSQDDDTAIHEFKEYRKQKQKQQKRYTNDGNNGEDDGSKRNNEEWTIDVTGSSQSNIHPGLAISQMCRQASRHPMSHPNNENLLLFLEKDWQLQPSGKINFMLNHDNFDYDGDDDGGQEEDHRRRPPVLRTLFDSVRTLMQRGVNYVRLTSSLNNDDDNPAYKNAPRKDKSSGRWNCPSEGVPWVCETSHQHRWTNLPLVVKCDWYLRYLEPYALMTDPIMYGCRRGFQRSKYFDWEEAMQDGRIEWTNSQWVIASIVLNGPPSIHGKHGIWNHVEIDQ